MAATAQTMVPEEGKLLSESLSTVKIQTQQMKRHLVRRVMLLPSYPNEVDQAFSGSRPAHGRTEEREPNVGRVANFFPVSETVLRIVFVRALLVLLTY